MATKKTANHGKSESTGATSVFPIVGIGASADGLEAFEQFFHHVQPDTGMAFVLVPHLDPGHACPPTPFCAPLSSSAVE